MRYIPFLFLLLAAPAQAQTPPAQLGLFETWAPVSVDSVGTGARLVYVGASSPADSAEVAYGESGGVAAWRAIVDGQVWAKTLTGGTFPVSVELGEIEYYLATHPDERERLEALLFDRDQLGFIRHFGMQQQSSPVSRNPAETVDLRIDSQDEAIRAARASCDVTDLLGECIEPPVPVVRSQ